MDDKSPIPSFLNLTGRLPSETLQAEAGQGFSHLSRDLGTGGTDRPLSFSILVDIFETDSSLEISAELPGFDEKSLEVAVSGSTLIIFGQKESRRSETVGRYHRTERSFGSFTRSFALPFRPQAGAIDARFEQGVLKITIGRLGVAPAATQNVPVRAADS